MASAQILSRVISPIAKPDVIGASRDDLYAGPPGVGARVELEAGGGATSYAWSIAFKPEGSTATFSGSALAQSPGHFDVDVEGPYLIRLQRTDAIDGTTEQFVRLRALTVFGQLKLVAAGERYDAVPIPVDNAPDGWADEQNFNLNALLHLIQVSSASTRLLYVDPEGDDATGTPFLTIQAAIDEANSHGPTSATPWVVLVRPGHYSEDLLFVDHVNVFGWPGGQHSDIVTIISTNGHGYAGADRVSLYNLSLYASAASPNPTLGIGSGELSLLKCLVASNGSGPALGVGPGSQCSVLESGVVSNSAAAADYAMVVLGTAIIRRCLIRSPAASGLQVGSTSPEVVLSNTIIEAGGDFAVSSSGNELIFRSCEIEGDIEGGAAGSGG